MTRKLQCIQKNELGNYVVVAKEVCRYAMKPGTVMGCNDDIPCDRMCNHIVLSITGQVTYKVMALETRFMSPNMYSQVARKIIRCNAINAQKNRVSCSISCSLNYP